MPSFDEHIQRAKHNIGFLKFILNSGFNDWVITVSFYSIIHVVEAAIFKKGEVIYRGNTLKIEHSEDLLKAVRANKIGPQNYSRESFTHHIARKIIVMENFPDIYDWFKMLYNYSRTARYKIYKWNDYEIQLTKKASNDIISWCNKQSSTDLENI